MSSPNSTFSEMVASTLRDHSDELHDNVSKNNALLHRLNANGKVDQRDGGLEIVEPLDYDENSTFQRYSGYDTLNVSPSEVISAAKYDWKQAAVHVTASGLEMRQNAGRSQLFKLAEARVANAIRSFSNKLSQDVYSDGTLPNQINGLQALIADSGLGTVGGIDASSWAFWKNAVQSAAAPLGGGAAVTPSKDTIQGLMLPLWLELTRGGDNPDLIVASNDYYSFYEESLSEYKRYAPSDEKATGGFVSLKYKTADVIFDGGAKGGGIPDAHMYFMNTDFLKLAVHKDANLTQVGEQRSINQDAVVIPIIWQGNLICSNRSLQGVLKA
ncbi:phage major capsid protein [Magnetofaba australis]|uniref:Putative 3-phosphoglycerate kinase n=1 Tax=Magnetofaba australis IT-1 TaxID=1434232 RepID=A0A1Y2K3V5_9PROT|nr:phage major capsid protein [Magnetofaba australis]OSM03956.1 putative 3-phosphoglycerate kinase [Magnetofaba australis IT-1]